MMVPVPASGEAAEHGLRVADAGLAVVGGTSLYRLAESSNAAEWFNRLGRAGILVRRFAEQPNWLRFGLPADESAWQRLSDALG